MYKMDLILCYCINLDKFCIFTRIYYWIGSKYFRVARYLVDQSGWIN